jgi:hypothetical protein
MKIALKLTFVALLAVFILRAPTKVQASTTCPYGSFNGCMNTVVGQYMEQCAARCASGGAQYDPGYGACMANCTLYVDDNTQYFVDECLDEGCIPE